MRGALQNIQGLKTGHEDYDIPLEAVADGSVAYLHTFTGIILAIVAWKRLYPTTFSPFVEAIDDTYPMVIPILIAICAVALLIIGYFKRFFAYIEEEELENEE